MDWESSGDSAAAFCRSRGINPATFYRWRRTHSVERPEFTEVRIEGAAPLLCGGVPLLSVTFAGDREIAVHDRGLAERLLELVSQPRPRS